MKMLKNVLFVPLCIVFLGLQMNGCNTEDQIISRNDMPAPDSENDPEEAEEILEGTFFENKSSLEPLVAIKPAFGYVEAFSLISSTDVLENGFRLVGAQDGAGFLPDGDGYIYIVNAEDNYAISRIRFDEHLNPVEGDWLLNSGVADFARQCSGTMWEADVHGGASDLFLSASESFNYDVKAIDPYIETPTPTADLGIDALGEFAWENAVPLPKDAYSGKTVIIGGDDDSSDSEGQITLYYSENGDADLENGKIYVLRLTEIACEDEDDIMPVTPETVYNESNLNFGISYGFEFVEIENGKDLTQTEMEEACMAVFATAFMRTEDVDYQKGADSNARNVFVAITGRGPGTGTYNDWGTVYKLELGADSPLSGKITQIVSGNTDTNNADGNLATLQSPDNICVTENYVYIQEDPNSFDRGHPAAIYQTDLNGNNPEVVLELIIRSDLSPTGSTELSGEFGALIDISDKIGVEDTFILNLQPHYWQDEDFKNLDGDNIELNATAVASGAVEDNQGGQIVILRGLPR